MKYDVAVHQDNRKQVAKLLDHPFLINYFYPNFILKKSALAKCLSSNREQDEDDNDDDDEDEEEEKKVDEECNSL